MEVPVEYYTTENIWAAQIGLVWFKKIVGYNTGWIWKASGWGERWGRGEWYDKIQCMKFSKTN